MKRILFLLYGLFAYIVTLSTMTYLIGFATTVLVPYHVDSGVESHWLTAVFINIGLVVLFGVQHSVMARPAFKARWTQIVPKPIERSTYVLIASLMTLLLMWQWRPISHIIWQAQTPTLTTLLYAVALGGWSLAVFATFLINHFDLFGLRQVVLYFQDRPYTPVAFKEPFLYRVVRHPMQLGIAIGLWVTPLMTVGHLLFAASLTLYILVGLYFEERDLIRQFGERYRQYQRTTPKLLPIPKPVQRPSDTAEHQGQTGLS